MNLVNSVMIVFALPVAGCVARDAAGGPPAARPLLRRAQGGSPLLWQHYFWIFGHPEVYIMILPAFGMISEIIPGLLAQAHLRLPFVAASTLAIAFLSYGVWVHHMFAVALGRTLLSVFAAASMLIAVPTGVKIFSWIATMFGGSIRFTTSMLFAVAFLLEFTIGGSERRRLRHGSGRLADDRYLLCRRPYSLRADRWDGLRDLRRKSITGFPNSPATYSTKRWAAGISG